MSWACNKQTAVSHSSTEASIILLDARLRVEGVPDLSVQILNLLYTQAGGGSKLVHQTQILKHLEPFGDIDDVLPNARLFSMRTSYYIFEDNEAVIKQTIRGRSPTMCHASRTHLVDMERLSDCISLEPMILIKYVKHNTTAGRHSYKRISHRRQMDITDNTGEHHGPHHLYSKQFVSFSCRCEFFIVQHE